ncbi:hypothetical protein AGOR_G00028840 [Albula goreensis]|uniref:V-set and immunoglobulin domain-containing protein 1 n=1 Tax=Albula goreensis TaxID=1534307 RepID=A0A8T3E7F3_9TELE|nr:hypothetical protein AGOR_G00028840 [Albula goreensis]
MLTSQFCLIVLFSLIGNLHSLTVKTSPKSVNVTNGGNVTLLCTFTTTADSTSKLTIQWSFTQKSSMAPQQVYFYLDGSAVVGEDFAGRVIGPSYPNTTRNASITITKMNPSDSGMYTCEVLNFPDADGKIEGNIIVNVLERPSTPFCAIHGTVESGHRVSLTCHTERGNPPPTYTWTNLDQGRSRSVLGRSNTQTGVMTIGNLSEFQFGHYQCNASNILGFSTCIVELTEELGDGAIAGAVIASLLAAGLVVFLVWYITHRLKKKNQYKAAKAKGSTEMQARPQSGDSVKYASVQAHQPSTKALPVPQDPSAQYHEQDPEV